MAELILTGVETEVFHELQARAAIHGRSPADEAKAILSAALHSKKQGGWEPVDAIYEHLAASHRTFSDSAELLREDRDR